MTTELKTWEIAEAAKQLIIGRIKKLDLGWDVADQTDADGNLINVQYPCILVIMADMADRALEGDSTLKQWMFPVGIVLIDNATRKLADPKTEGSFLNKRFKLMDAFHQKKILSDDSKIGAAVTVETRNVFDTRQPPFQGIRSQFIIWCEMWTPRNPPSVFDYSRNATP